MDVFMACSHIVKLPTSFRYPLSALDITIVLYFCHELPKASAINRSPILMCEKLGLPEEINTLFACLSHFSILWILIFLPSSSPVGEEQTKEHSGGKHALR